jgi:hypothetical protein
VSKYWDLYVLYIERCVRENYENDIDPAHYEMEWNHFWPKSIFGDWPVGQFLTVRQHAIASALQTLVFRENCMCAWHKSYISAKLLELAWPYYCIFAKKNAVKGGKKAAAKLHEEKDEDGKSLHGKRSSVKLNSAKDEQGRSINSMKAKAKVHAEKDKFGRSVRGVESSVRLNKEKDEFGRSINAVKGGNRHAKKVRVTSPEGFTRTFDSISLVARFFQTKSDSIVKRIKKGPSRCGKLCGIRFELTDM